MWVDNFMSFLNFKFRATVGSHFWDLLQEVLQQVLESLSIPEKGIEKSLRNPQKKKNPPFTENENNSRKERWWPKPHSSKMTGRQFHSDILASTSRAC